MEIIKTDKAPLPIGPYSQAVVAGNTLYISGQIAIDPQSRELKIDDLKAETHLVLGNIGAILRRANCDFKDIVKCSIFLSDMDNFSVVNEIYGSYFTDVFPARETVEVSKLPKGVNVEISAIAVKP